MEGFPGHELESHHIHLMVADVVLEDPRWQTVDLETLADRCAEAVLRELGLDPGQFELCVMGCDDTRMARLNEDFRGKAMPTDVLSWPLRKRVPLPPGTPPGLPRAPDDGSVCELGDIAVAFDVCAREAAAADRSVADHAAHLIVHGVLHLLHYDHIDSRDSALMEGLEAKILGKLGIPDPYGD